MICSEICLKKWMSPRNRDAEKLPAPFTMARSAMATARKSLSSLSLLQVMTQVDSWVPKLGDMETHVEGLPGTKNTTVGGGHVRVLLDL